jgi:sugar transferase (PEP-CTERM/EpsH1 system associated)
LKTKLLVLASRFPWPLEKGDKLRLFHQLRFLSEQFDIVLCALVEEVPPPQDVAHIRPYCPQIHLLRLKKHCILWQLLAAPFVGRPFQVAYFYDAKLREELQRIIAETGPDCIYCQLIRCAPYFAHIPHPNKTLDYMDAFSSGMERRAAALPWPFRWPVAWEAARTARFERDALGWFEKHCIISDQDKNALAIAPDAKQHIATIPNGVDSAFFRPSKKQNPSFELVFVGNLGYAPNVAAARFLVREVLPELELLGVKARLLLAGARPSRAVQRLAGRRVVLWADLPDIRSAYNAARIFVAPLFTGSGQQNKILEAMSLGLPCVTTPLVNNAIGAVDGQSIMLANDGQTFAVCIARLLRDAQHGRSLSENAMRFVQSRYTWEQSTATLAALLKAT